MKNEKIDNIEAKIQRNNREYKAEVKAVNEDEKLSAVGKRNKVEKLKDEFHQRHQDYLAELEQQTNEQYDKLKKSAFNTSANKSTADKLAFDQAVMQFADTEDLKGKVGSISSTVTARALAKAAYNKGDSEALTAVYDNFDELNGPIGELSDFEAKYVHERMDTGDKLKRKMAITGPPRPESGV